MIPYFKKPPYSNHPVRPIHIGMIAAFILLFAAGSYFLGALLTLRLLILGMMLYAVGLWIYFLFHLARALHRKEAPTLYGPVTLADRPALFVVICVGLVLVPLLLLGGLIYIAAQDPQLQVFQWLRTVYTTG